MAGADIAADSMGATVLEVGLASALDPVVAGAVVDFTMPAGFGAAAVASTLAADFAAASVAAPTAAADFTGALLEARTAASADMVSAAATGAGIGRTGPVPVAMEGVDWTG
jgi:hypothetical protein